MRGGRERHPPVAFFSSARPLVPMGFATRKARSMIVWASPYVKQLGWDAYGKKENDANLRTANAAHRMTSKNAFADFRAIAAGKAMGPMGRAAVTSPPPILYRASLAKATKRSSSPSPRRSPEGTAASKRKLRQHAPHQNRLLCQVRAGADSMSQIIGNGQARLWCRTTAF